MNTSESFLASPKVNLGLGFQKIGQGNPSEGLQYVSQAIQNQPALAQELTHLIPEWIMKQKWASPIDLAHAFVNALPNDLSKSGHLHQDILGQIYVAESFNAYSAGQRKLSIQNILNGARYNPSILKNRGILSILAKSLLKSEPAEAAQTSYSEGIPGAIENEIREALGNIDRVDRVTNTKRAIYFLHARDRDFVLHILEEGIKELEGRIAISHQARSVGVPAPALLFSSLSRTMGQGSHWIIEEKMPGLPFNPSKLSQSDQLSAAADLGHHLKQLHGIKVKGFGLFTSPGLDTRYPDFAAWLTDQQKYILEGCFLGIIPETVFPAIDRAYRFLMEAYPEFPVMCHCELSDQNILIAGGKISGLIDWESAGGNDPAYDVAVFMTTMSNYWYPDQDQDIFSTILKAYNPNESNHFMKRVQAHRLLFIASSLPWIIQLGYGDEQYHHLLISILNDSQLTV